MEAAVQSLYEFTPLALLWPCRNTPAMTVTTEGTGTQREMAFAVYRGDTEFHVHIPQDLLASKRQSLNQETNMGHQEMVALLPYCTKLRYVTERMCYGVTDL